MFAWSRNNQEVLEQSTQRPETGENDLDETVKHIRYLKVQTATRRGTELQTANIQIGSYKNTERWKKNISLSGLLHGHTVKKQISPTRSGFISKTLQLTSKQSRRMKQLRGKICVVDFVKVSCPFKRGSGETWQLQEIRTGNRFLAARYLASGESGGEANENKRFCHSMTRRQEPHLCWRNQRETLWFWYFSSIQRQLSR